MKKILGLSILLLTITFGYAQNKKGATADLKYIVPINNLTLDAAFELQKQAAELASKYGKKVSVAILDASGTPILITRGAGVGPHNTEAARRKAFTSLSTKTPTLD